MPTFASICAEASSIRFSFIVLVLLCIVVLAGPGGAIQGDTVDSANHPWPCLFAPTPFSSRSAHVMTVFEGELVVARVSAWDGLGDFHGVAAWNGERWRPMGDLRHRLIVVDLAEYMGRLVIAGSCERVDCDKKPLAWWDGEEWIGFGKELVGSIRSLTTWRDLLVIGGRFQVEGLPDARNLVAWDGASWQVIPGRCLADEDDCVMALAVYDGDLVVGGTFEQVDGVPSANVARYDGKHWIGMDGGTDGRVTNLVSHDGTLYVAGEFTQAGGSSISNLAAWNGRRWSDVGGGFRRPDSRRLRAHVKTLKSRGDRLLVGGQFRGLAGKLADGIAAWDGEVWHVPAPTSVFPTSKLPDLVWDKATAMDLESNSDETSQKLHALFEGDHRGSLVTEVEQFQGELVACVAENMAYPRELNYYEQFNIIRWTGERWEWLGWSGNEVLCPDNKTGIYRGQLVMSNRLSGNTPDLLEIWDGDSWKSLVRIPSEFAPETMLVRGLEIDGDLLYMFVRRGIGEDNWQSMVLVYDGQTVRSCGAPLEHVYERYSQLVTDGERLVLAGRRVHGNRPEATSTVMVLTDAGWQRAVGAPEIHRVSDAIGTSDGIFLSTWKPTGAKDSRRSEPTIWRWSAGRWESVWNHDSGRVPILYHDGEHLWAAVSEASIDDRTPPPLMRWDGTSWHPFGEILIGDANRGETARIECMTVYQGTPVISCKSLDIVNFNDYARYHTYFWGDGRWLRCRGFESPLTDMHPLAKRLWVKQRSVRDVWDLPLTWFDGELISDLEIATEQVELWRGLKEAREPK